MSLLLYIDTAASIATAALSGDGRLLSVRTHADSREQAALLNGMIGEVLAEAGHSLSAVDGICVCAGPGSYTGIRVGLSTAKGLAYALDKPLWLFNRLDLLAQNFTGKGPFSLALKARAGEYFFSSYQDDGSPASPARHVFAAALETGVAPGTLFITDDEAFPLPGFKLVPTGIAPVMEQWIRLATQRLANGQPDDLAYAEPFYLKAAFTTQSKK